MSDVKKDFYRYNSRVHQPLQLSQWFSRALDNAISNGDISFNANKLANGITSSLAEYRKINNIDNVVIGLSGGIDSALTASLFKAAGWTVTGVLLPIKQNPIETFRGIECAKALDINYKEVDLTTAYQKLEDFFSNSYNDPVDAGLQHSTKEAKVRAGNIRARLRMITLYNIAAQLKGCVGSTDNFSELAAGFWTLHGDVGDIAPIQSLTKSWEVPMLAEYMGVPASIIEAIPTDGLGISKGDEAQFGFSYAELDLWLWSTMMSGPTDITDAELLEIKKFKDIEQRVRNSAFKRANPVNFDHPVSGSRRYHLLSRIDETLISDSIKHTNTPEVQNV